MAKVRTARSDAVGMSWWIAAISGAIALGAVSNCPQELAAEETPSTIKSEEQVIFFPTAARMSADAKVWETELHGWIFEPEQGDLLRARAVEEARDLLDLNPEEPSTDVFKKRMRLFLVDNERDKRVGVRIAGETFVLNSSGADGHFTGTVRIKADAVAKMVRESGVATFTAVLPEGDKRKFGGLIYCLKDEGTSVISDIDDTIKRTGVRSKATLIRQTLFREFEAIDDLDAVYRKWAKDGATFHYMSAAPWQLYEPLAEYLVSEDFPHGTFHLKRLRLKDQTFFSLFADPVAYKLAIIEPFMKQFPERKFVLVGDSGEKDPEIYATLAGRFPRQVEKIYIRDVTGETADAARYKTVFAKVPAEKWQVFKDAEELGK